VIQVKYSLVIEATEDPSFFGFYSPDLARTFTQDAGSVMRNICGNSRKKVPCCFTRSNPDAGADLRPTTPCALLN